MKKVNYNTGVGSQTAITLKEAKIIADKNCTYTGTNITIEEDGRILSARKFYPVEFDPENDDSRDPIIFGTFGYYADWVDFDQLSNSSVEL